MSNIWEFLYQTVNVSLVALLILVLRKIFDGKLSPRFMYFVWSVLALRVLVPASLTRNTILSLGVAAEYTKSICERSLSSAYAAEFEPLTMRAAFPYVTQSPKSVTDVIFIVYIVGIVVFLLWHTVSFVRLRVILRSAPLASEEKAAKVRAVCEKYSLKPCRVKEAEVPTAFVCGVFRPVLVLPRSTETDEKIILHEMLHLKYKDIAAGVFICILRALHWCNPFLHYVFSRIENDIETLCDYRVLERLSGEDRREYGKLLLFCANERYAHAVGTSSVSNGGKNIASRIESIVRFKKYPSGMAIVSVCIVALMCAFCIVGVKAEYDTGLYNPTYGEYDEAFAMARINRCTTPAGALDTFAKAKIYSNSVYLAMCSPMEMQEKIKNNEFTEDAELIYANGSYSVVNMQKTGKDIYSAYVSIIVSAFENETGDLIFRDGTIFIPVTVYRENGWVVEETGQRTTFSLPYYGGNVTPPVAKRVSCESVIGSLDILVSVRSTVNNRGESLFSPGDKIENRMVQTDCDFESSSVQIDGNFEFYNNELFSDKKYFSVVIGVYEKNKEKAALPKTVLQEIDGDNNDQGAYLYQGQLVNSVYEWYRYAKYSTNTLNNKDIPAITIKNNYNFGYSPCELPSSLNVWIVADGEVIEEFTVEVE